MQSQFLEEREFAVQHGAVVGRHADLAELVDELHLSALEIGRHLLPERVAEEGAEPPRELRLLRPGINQHSAGPIGFLLPLPFFIILPFFMVASCRLGRRSEPRLHAVELREELLLTKERRGGSRAGIGPVGRELPGRVRLLLRERGEARG